MALTKIHSILCLLDLEFSGRKKLDGMVRIGVGDGLDDLTGRVTDVSRRPSRICRPHSGDSWSQTFSATQCLEYNRTRWLRHYCCESRELSLFSALVFGIMCLGSEADFLQFFRLDLEFLSDLEDCFYLVGSGAGLTFGHLNK